MGVLMYLFEKNVIKLKEYSISLFLGIFLPIVAIALMISFKNIPLDTYNEDNFNANPVSFNLSEKVNNLTTEVKYISKSLSKKGLFLMMKEDVRTKFSNLLDFMINKTTGIAHNITEIDKESKYFDKRNKSSEIFEVELVDNISQFKLYSRSFTIYYWENEMSDLYNIPTSNDIGYVNSLQIYFAKYLLSEKNVSIDDSISITFYPIRPSKYVRMLDSSDKKTNFQKSCILQVSISFIGFSLSFIGIFMIFSLVLLSEKKHQIKELLKFQGISEFQYYFSWFVTYFVVMILPMIMYTVLIIKYRMWNKAGESKKRWTVILTIIEMTCFSLNIFFASVFFSVVFSLKFISGLAMFFIYFLPPLGYMLLYFFQTFNYFLKVVFYIIPQVNFSVSLEFIFLGTFYENGLNPELFRERYKQIDYIQLKFISLVVPLIFIITILLNIVFNSRKVSTLTFGENKIAPNIENTVIDPSFSSEANSYSQEKMFQKFFEDSVSEVSQEKFCTNTKFLKINRVSKAFGGFAAVKSLSTIFYPGEIFVLLGHNGAGKTTLLNMITGTIGMDKGEILLDGISIAENSSYLRSSLGACLQKDIFFPEMTVAQQLRITYKIKMSKNKKKINYIKMESKIRKMLSRLNLEDYKDIKGRNLKGGNLRKLCAALALMGKSRLLIFDEPTSGMDNHTRKKFWDFLKEEKKNKIIIITTHSMKEAEYLGDKIGIMAEGELICQGSPGYLKKMYPCGFNINLILEPNSLPFYRKAQWINELKKVEPELIVKVLSKNLIKINFPEAALRNNRVKAIFKKIKETKKMFHISEYTVSSTTLEDVFFKVNDTEFTKNLYEKEMSKALKGHGQINENDSRSSDLQMSEIFSDSESDYNDMNRSINTTLLDEDLRYQRNSNEELKNLLSKRISKASTLTQTKSKPKCSLFTKYLFRFSITFYRNIFSLLLQLAFSFLFLIYALGLVSLQEKTLFDFTSIDEYFENSTNIRWFIIKDENNSNSDDLSNYLDKSYLNLDMKHEFGPINEQTYDSFMNSYKFGNSKAFIYIKKSKEKNKYSYNYTIYYKSSSPDITYLLLNSILRKQLKERGITSNFLSGYIFNPKKNSNYYISKLSYNILVFWLFCFSHLVASSYYLTTPIIDSARGVKVLLLLRKMNISLYWLALFMISFLKYILFSTLFQLFIYFQDAYVWRYFFISILLGINVVLLSFVFSFFSKCYFSPTFLYFIFNLGLLLIPGILKLGENSLPSKSSEESNMNSKELNMNFLPFLSPISSMAYFILKHRIKEIIKPEENSGVAFEWTLLIVLVCQCLSYLLILVILETGSSGSILHSVGRFLCCCLRKRENNISLMEPLFESSSHETKPMYSLIIEGLKVKYRQLFHKSVVAVDGLTLQITENSTFGMMGKNGAGKTSTIKSIINEITPNEGSITYKNIDLLQGPIGNNIQIGYCPQTNSIFDDLTVKETLQFYDTRTTLGKAESSRKSETLEDKIDILLEELHLKNYKDVKTKYLSEGNKRKLLLGIALQSNSNLILLDEPSTGVDPQSRRIMWRKLINFQRSRRNRKGGFNCIISTQSLEETEVLCDTVGWMENGRFKYTGNTENLRIKISEGYSLRIRMNKPSERDLFDFKMSSNIEFFESLSSVQDINKLSIDKVRKKEDYETLYYLSALEDFCEKLIEMNTTIKFVERIENEFVFILYLPKKKKGSLFANILNFKNINQVVSDVSINLQFSENSIEDFY